MFLRDPKYEAKIAELQKQLRDFEHARNKEIEELKRMHMKELEDAKSGKKNMEKELDDLRKKLAAEMKEMEDRLAKVNNDDVSSVHAFSAVAFLISLPVQMYRKSCCTAPAMDSIGICIGTCSGIRKMSKFYI